MGTVSLTAGKANYNTMYSTNQYNADMVRLTRITSGGKVLSEVEGLRFIAIVTVVFHHLIGNIFSTHHPFWPTGRFGVMLFFSISGFILALRFAQEYLNDGPEIRVKAYFYAE